MFRRANAPASARRRRASARRARADGDGRASDRDERRANRATTRSRRRDARDDAIYDDMEEVFGTFWRDVLGDDDDDDDDDDDECVRIKRPTREGDADRRAVLDPRVNHPEINKRSFVGVVRGEDGDGTVDVLYRTREGKATSARVRADDAHEGFLGKVLESWTATVGAEEEEEERTTGAEEGNGTARRRRRGASELSTSAERTIKTAMKMNGKSDIVTVEQMETLREALPAMYRMREWTLAYSTKRDGISLKSLYRRASGKANTVLLVSDSGGAIFGAFCTEAWKVHSRYGGTGESFVFTLAPEGVKYAWSGANDYYMLGAADSLSVGGGSAHAIRLEEDLLQGSSGECETFQSPPLASENMFRTARIELWSLE